MKHERMVEIAPVDDVFVTDCEPEPISDDAVRLLLGVRRGQDVRVQVSLVMRRADFERIYDQLSELRRRTTLHG